MERIASVLLIIVAVSGVYLYSVQADDTRFEDFIGKFVVIR